MLKSFNLSGEALALACAGNVPNLKREKNSEMHAMLCNVYINAWEDTVVAFVEGKPFCPPSITLKEMSVVFFDYLASHKDARELNAAEALMLAFKDKWPCH